MAVRSKPYTIDAPLNAEKAENINEMFEILFDDMGKTAASLGTTINVGSGAAGPMGPPGLAGADGDDGAQGPPGSGSAGANGSQGPTGAAGPLFLMRGEDGDDGIMGPPGPAGAAGSGSTTTEFTVTTTGNIDDLDFSNANSIRMNNASLSTIRGLKAGTAGQVVTIVSIGAGQVSLAHQNTGSTAANRFINSVTSISTGLAPGLGFATYQYDGTTARWRLINHDQGASITITGQTYSGSGAMTWTTVIATTYAYWIKGTQCLIYYQFGGTTVGGVPDFALYVTLPFTVTLSAFNPDITNDAGTIRTGTAYAGIPGGAPNDQTLAFFANQAGTINWTAGTTGIKGQVFVTVL